MKKLAWMPMYFSALSLLQAQTAKTATQSQVASQVQTLYASGVTAMKDGDVTKADTCFRTILKYQPGHSYARYQLGELNAHKNEILVKAREKQFAAVVIPQVDFTDSSLTEALNALSIMIDKQTEKKLNPNFVIIDPDKKLSDKTVTLKLANMPATAVLNYILESTKAKAKYDLNSTVISPSS